MSRSLGGLMAAAATASTPVPRMTTGGRSVMPTRSLFPMASRHSRTHTARTSVVRSGVRATTLIGGVHTDDLVAEERDTVAEPVRLVEVVRAQEHGPTLATQRDDEVAHRLRRVRIETGRRLVEE